MLGLFGIISIMKTVKISDYKTELEKNGTIAFVAEGYSMWPIIKHRGSSVIVESKKERLTELEVGFYKRQDGTYVLHRVIEVLPDGYVMCGDSQLFIEKVSEEQVFGKLVGFYKKANYVDCADEKYINKVKKWYKNKGLRKVRIKFFNLKNKLKSILKKGSKKADVWFNSTWKKG